MQRRKVVVPLAFGEFKAETIEHKLMPVRENIVCACSLWRESLEILETIKWDVLINGTEMR